MGTIRDKKLKNEEQRLIVSQDNKLIQKMSTDLVIFLDLKENTVAGCMNT